MNIQRLKEWAALDAARKELDAKAKELMKKLAAAESLALAEMVQDGVPSVSVDGRRIAIRTYVRSGPVGGDKDAVIEALQSIEEIECFVVEGYSPQKLDAYVREVADGVEAACKQDRTLFDAKAVRAALPPALAGVLNVLFDQKLRSTKA